MHSKLVALLCLSFSALHSAEIEFVGFLRSGTESRFVVALPEKGATSGWIKVGERFQEFTVTGFDEKTEALQVSGPNGAVTLYLKASRVLPDVPTSFRTPLYIDVTPEGVVAIGRETANFDSLRKFLVAAIDADPEVYVIVRAKVEADAPWLQLLFRSINDVARSVGARGIGLIAKPPNKAPEPATTADTPRAP